VSDLAREFPDLARFRRDALEEVETETKYAGYIVREAAKAERMRRDEARHIPADADYDRMPELRFEAREKLKSHHPETLAQATRISGVNPADVSILMLYLKKGMPVLHTISGRSLR
jgi:tRNA uridine 5-carboxymethylaminomethyl modification enzyme